MLCPFCQEAIDPKTAWKGSADQFYCSEFCADSEMIVPASSPAADKTRFDVQYRNRLERLVQLRRSASL
jgi:hypothetical protein